MPDFDVFFYEAFAEEVPPLQRHLPAGIRAGYDAATIQEAGHTTPPAAVISIRTQSVVPAAWLPALKGIQTRSTGYDHLAALRRAHPDAPPCASLPKYCGRAVAEQALLLWMALLRRLPAQVRQFDTFHRDGLTGSETAGRTLLVAGAGDIGGHVADIGRGLDMHVLATDPVRRHPELTYVTLDEGLAAADVIVCAMNLTRETRGLFNRATLTKARPGALFVNVSRGEISPPADLLRLLEEGRLGGVGLDVYDDEPKLAAALRAGSTSDDDTVRTIRALRARPDVILTPHNAFNTAEATERKSIESALDIARFLASGRFAHPLPPA
jgi:D-lactate dehydrogenase